MEAFLFSCLCLGALASIDNGILYPGYVVNFQTPDNTVDFRYAAIPVTLTEGNPLNLTLGLAIDAFNPLSPPKDYIRIQRYNPPYNNSVSPVLTNDGDKAVAVQGVTDGFWFLSSESSCGTGQCHDSVDAEVSAWLYRPDGTHYMYQLLNQRRTAKFNIPYPSWIYYWLLVTNNDLDSSGQFFLYLGTQFYSNNANSGVQMFVNPMSVGCPNTTVGTPGMYWPLSAIKGGWIQSEQPLSLTVGTYCVGAANMFTTTAQFTNKVGFNAPPIQAANLNASFSRFGLLVLILICSLVTVKRI